jgi:predicted transcriptional regulator
MVPSVARISDAQEQPEVGLAAEAIRSSVELQEWQIGEIGRR